MPPARPAGQPPADLLGGVAHHRPGHAGLEFGVGDVEGDEEEGHGEAVVEPALHIERLTYAGRNRRVGDDLLAERRVGRGQHRREQDDGRERHAGEDQCADPGPGDHRERQPDQQQTGRPSQLVAERSQVEPGRVAEQQQHERHLGDALSDGGFHGDVEPAEGRGADDEAGDGEEERRGDPAPIERSGERAPDDDDRHDGRRCYHATPASSLACPPPAARGNPIAVAAEPGANAACPQAHLLPGRLSDDREDGGTFL